MIQLYSFLTSSPTFSDGCSAAFLLIARKKILSDIQDGTFAKDFLLDMSPAGGQAHFRAMRRKAAEHPSEKVGEEIRKLYSWSNEDKLINN